jgi:L-lactate dehydrogenase complex protein LldF
MGLFSTYRLDNLACIGGDDRMQNNIEELIDRFKGEAHRAGFVIYEVTNASDACDYILKLGRERDIKTAVKSRSKIADAIELRENLQKAGIGVIEADLKEWLSQMAGGKKGRRVTTVQMEKLVSKVIGQKLGNEPQALLNTINKTVRQHCIDADLGISEADVAIAETGTVVIVGNEGVTRLVAVLPRIHVTLLEAEKVVPLMEDVFTRVDSLSWESANQMVPAYVTYITGRNTTADIPGAVLARAQGPAEEHIILISSMAKRSKV